MIVFRLGSKKFSDDLTGEGAKIAGGRWNKIGTPYIYAAASRALCTIEFSAHKSIDIIPVALTITRYRIPENRIVEYKMKDLPGNWRNWPYEDDLRDFGNKWLNSSGPLIIALPSVMVPQELNFIFNVFHPNFNEITIEGIEPYIYDVRIKA